MASLFDIDEDILRLISLEDEDVIDSETGEVLIDVYAELDKLAMQREEKIINIARYIDDLDRDKVKLKEKIAQLTARARSKEKQSERLRAYLIDSMVKLGSKKIEDETVTVKLNTTKVARIICEDELPRDYLNTVVEVKPDKKKILADLKSGKEIAGAELAESNSITVR